MFRGGQANSYEEIVAKTTDENLTSENWELILNLCDKVQEEGEQGARNVIAAVLKRLAHRNPNVQLYALALGEALSKNCGTQVNREIASRSFTQGLERIITDRTSHDKVKRKALSLIAMWTADFESDPSLGIMDECYESLKAKGYKFEEPSEPPPPQVDDEIRRREEEELQRALEMSVLDKGGRTAWDSYNAGSSSSNAGPSSSAAPAPASSSRAADVSSTPTSAAPRYGASDYGYAKSTSGYVPAISSSPKAQSPVDPMLSLPSYSAASSGSAQANSSSQTPLPLTSVSRVRALHTFEGTEQGELTFEKGDIIKVVDRNYKDWWRGQLKGRTGIFPVNYVEMLPDPTPDEIAREAEQEAAVFAQAANIDKLLSMLRGLDPARDSLADNEEIQELYRTSMSLRPKIVKLIDKYSQKRSELVSMNETFVKARNIFDRMMEESLARHSGLYEGRPAYQAPPQQDYRIPGFQGPYDQGYAGFPQPNPGYAAVPSTPGPQPYAAPGYPAQQPSYSPYPAQQGASPYGPPQSQPPPDTAGPYGQYQQPAVGQPQPGPQPQAQVPPQMYAQQQQQPQQPQPQPQQQQQPHSPQPQHQLQEPSQVPAQAAQHNGYQESQPQIQAQVHPQQQGQAPSVAQGPPYVYDPNATYPDPGAQAWAQYYAAGGTDPTGAVYFFSVPGVTDGQAQQPPIDQPQAQSQPEPQATQRAGSMDGHHTQPSGSPTAERTSFYQAHPAQAPGYNGSQPHLAQNGSAASLGSPTQPLSASAAQGNMQYPVGAPQQYQSQTSDNSPTVPNTSYGGGSFYGAAQAQPSSPGAGVPPAQEAYPPNPYPDPAHAASPPLGHPADPHAQYQQMHGQFAAMGMGEPRSPSAAVPAVQTA